MYKQIKFLKKYTLAFEHFRPTAKRLSRVYRTGIRNWKNDDFRAYSIVAGTFRIMFMITRENRSCVGSMSVLFFLLLPIHLLAQTRRPAVTDDGSIRRIILPRDNVNIGLSGFYRNQNKKPTTLSEDKPIPGKAYTFAELLWLNDGQLIGYNFNRDSLGVERAIEPQPMLFMASDTLIRRCPQCIREGSTSRLYIGSSTMTAMYCGDGYYNEQGKWVAPPRCNTISTECHCSRGHRFTYSHK